MEKWSGRGRGREVTKTVGGGGGVFGMSKSKTQPTGNPFFVFQKTYLGDRQCLYSIKLGHDNFCFKCCTVTKTVSDVGRTNLKIVSLASLHSTNMARTTQN